MVYLLNLPDSNEGLDARCGIYLRLEKIWAPGSVRREGRPAQRG